MCPASGVAMDSCLRRRRTDGGSRVDDGDERHVMGTMSNVIESRRVVPTSETDPSSNPSSIEPESPMKMLAG